MTPCSVLVVDDSATMRALIRRVLLRDPGIRVVGEAGNAQDARAAIKALNPDVITLDIEMPEMNGLDFLERLMRLRPMPVVMVSTLTAAGAEATLRALEIGAIDCVAKPSNGSPNSFDRLPEAIHAAAAARIAPAAMRAAVQAPSHPHAQPTAAAYVPSPGMPTTDTRLIAIGASTGGVEALIQVLSRLPANCPPVAIVQHMPPLFTASFAQRLDRLSALSVTEAVDGAILAPGTAVVAPGGERHLEIVGSSGGPLRCRLVADDLESGHRPSVDRLFRSVAQVVRARALGVILTGMGSDGAAGLLALREAGAHTIGQDEATSLVFGMPKAAHRLGAVAEQLSLNQIAAGIVRALHTPKTNRSRTNAHRTTY